MDDKDFCPLCKRLKPGRRRKRIRNRERVRRGKLALQGRCHHCGEPIGESQALTVCEACRLYVNQISAGQRLQRLEEHLCVKCGVRPPESGRKRCTPCLGKQTARMKKNREDGMCRCGRFRVPGRQSCESCLAGQAKKMRRRRAARLNPQDVDTRCRGDVRASANNSPQDVVTRCSTGGQTSDI